jgi:hypothetical protein
LNWRPLDHPDRAFTVYRANHCWLLSVVDR